MSETKPVEWHLVDEGDGPCEDGCDVDGSGQCVICGATWRPPLALVPEGG